MPNQQVENLEALISKISYEIVSEGILEETEINKLLGVLASNGVYAMWVYALDKFDVKFFESQEELKNQKIFKFLAKISEIDKKTFKELNFDNLINELADITREIKQLRQEINNLNKEIKQMRNRGENTDTKEREKREKEDNVRNKEKERIEKFNEFFIRISNDLHKLLFLKQLLEKTLIYARYHAKALGD